MVTFDNMNRSADEAISFTSEETKKKHCRNAIKLNALNIEKFIKRRKNRVG